MRSSIVTGTFLFLSITVAIYEAVVYYHGYVVGHSFHLVWALVSNLLLLFWLVLDAKKRPEVYRPYEFGFLALVFWFPYFPYYLIQTRRAYGFLLLVGVFALPWLGYVLQWLIYVVR